MTTTTSSVALLAPVPEEHLLSGAVVCATEGKVAFGSRAWQVFRRLDEMRSGVPVDVYLYASHAGPGGPPLVTWHSRYVRHMDSVGGAHLEGMRYRPPSTAKYENDNAKHWAVFWEVEDLRELGPGERIPIKDLCGLDKPNAYASNFVPEGPLLIQHP